MPGRGLADLIDTAIKREEDAYAFYMDLNDKVDDASVKETLEWIAAEERKHKEFLVSYREGDTGQETLRMSDVVLYKLAEHQKEPDVKASMRIEDLFLIAAHRELRSYNFYSELAQLHSHGDTHEILLKIANEELKHKEKMEYLYANTAFPQTSGG
ncbi:MAG: ferritin family protein [Desulfobacterales bacterium]|jgi:rubrerythrin